MVQISAGDGDCFGSRSAMCCSNKCLHVWRQLLIEEPRPPPPPPPPIQIIGWSRSLNWLLSSNKPLPSGCKKNAHLPPTATPLVSMTDAPLTTRAPGNGTDDPLHDPKHLLLIRLSFIPRSNKKCKNPPCDVSMKKQQLA